MSVVRIKETEKKHRCIMCGGSHRTYQVCIGEEAGREVFNQPLCYTCLFMMATDFNTEIKRFISGNHAKKQLE